MSKIDQTTMSKLQARVEELEKAARRGRRLRANTRKQLTALRTERDGLKQQVSKLEKQLQDKQWSLSKQMATKRTARRKVKATKLEPSNAPRTKAVSSRSPSSSTAKETTRRRAYQQQRLVAATAEAKRENHQLKQQLHDERTKNQSRATALRQQLERRTEQLTALQHEHEGVVQQLDDMKAQLELLKQTSHGPPAPARPQVPDVVTSAIPQPTHESDIVEQDSGLPSDDSDDDEDWDAEFEHTDEAGACQPLQRATLSLAHQPDSADDNSNEEDCDRDDADHCAHEEPTAAGDRNGPASEEKENHAATANTSPKQQQQQQQEQHSAPTRKQSPHVPAATSSSSSPTSKRVDLSKWQEDLDDEDAWNFTDELDDDDEQAMCDLADTDSVSYASRKGKEVQQVVELALEVCADRRALSTVPTVAAASTALQTMLHREVEVLQMIDALKKQVEDRQCHGDVDAELKEELLGKLQQVHNMVLATREAAACATTADAVGLALATLKPSAE